MASQSRIMQILSQNTRAIASEHGFRPNGVHEDVERFEFPLEDFGVGRASDDGACDKHAAFGRQIWRTLRP